MASAGIPGSAKIEFAPPLTGVISAALSGVFLGRTAARLLVYFSTHQRMKHGEEF